MAGSEKWPALTDSAVGCWWSRVLFWPGTKFGSRQYERAVVRCTSDAFRPKRSSTMAAMGSYGYAVAWEPRTCSLTVDYTHDSG
jgi:hypothetical protein